MRQLRAFILLETDDGPEIMPYQFNALSTDEEARALGDAMDAHDDYADPEGSTRGWVLIVPSIGPPYLVEPTVSPSQIREARRR